MHIQYSISGFSMVCRSSGLFCANKCCPSILSKKQGETHGKKYTKAGIQNTLCEFRSQANHFQKPGSVRVKGFAYSNSECTSRHIHVSDEMV